SLISKAGPNLMIWSELEQNRKSIASRLVGSDGYVTSRTTRWHRRDVVRLVLRGSHDHHADDDSVARLCHPHQHHPDRDRHTDAQLPGHPGPGAGAGAQFLSPAPDAAAGARRETVRQQRSLAGLAE